MSLLNQTYQLLLDIFFPSKGSQNELFGITALEFSTKAHRSDFSVSTDTAFLTNAIVPFAYRDPLVREAVWAVKYRADNRVANMLGNLLHEELLEKLSDEAVVEANKRFLVVPIPLHKKRLRKRGLNQAELIARYLCTNNPEFLTLAPDILRRLRNTKSQTSTSNREERLKNIAGCFAVSPSVNINESDIILVDDVVTTGATMQEAMSTLLASGAKSVLPIAVAH